MSPRLPARLVLSSLRFTQVSAPGGSAALLSRLLRAAVGLLEEGGLEARTAGKRMLWELRRLLDNNSSSGSGGDDFRRALARLDCKQDKVGVGICWVVCPSRS